MFTYQLPHYPYPPSPHPPHSFSTITYTRTNTYLHKTTIIFTQKKKNHQKKKKCAQRQLKEQSAKEKKKITNKSKFSKPKRENKQPKNIYTHEKKHARILENNIYIVLLRIVIEILTSIFTVSSLWLLIVGLFFL